MKKDKRQLILDTLSDLLTQFFYYDRKEDDRLPVGAIEKAIRKGKISVEELVDEFREIVERSVQNG